MQLDTWKEIEEKVLIIKLLFRGKVLNTPEESLNFLVREVNLNSAGCFWWLVISECYVFFFVFQIEKISLLSYSNAMATAQKL